MSLVTYILLGKDSVTVTLALLYRLFAQMEKPKNYKVKVHIKYCGKVLAALKGEPDFLAIFLNLAFSKFFFGH